MKVAFDAKRIFNNTTGLGNYSRTLLDNLRRFHPELEYLLFTPSVNKKASDKNYAQEFKTITTNTRFKNLWRSYGIRKDLEQEKIDIYHGLSNEIPFWLRKIQTIVTIHDVIFKVLPNTYPKIDIWMYEEKTRYACRYANTIIAISEKTKSDLIKYYEVEPERIKVIYQACAPIYYEPLLSGIELQSNLKFANLPTEYILSVGSIIERKNLLNLIKAVHILPKNFQLPIVVVGQGKAYKKKIQQYLVDHQIEHLVYWVENLTETQDLKKLYQQAQLMVYPSLYEGFGLPVVEAMLCETPVITSYTSSLPEAGGQYTKLVNPTSIEELSAAIIELLNDSQRRKEMGMLGRADALDRFNPQKLTHQMVSLYLSMVDR